MRPACTLLIGLSSQPLTTVLLYCYPQHFLRTVLSQGNINHLFNSAVTINVILKPTASGVIQNDGDIISKNTHELSQIMESIFNVEDLFSSKYLRNTSNKNITK
jgi:hypothetical protein